MTAPLVLGIDLSAVFARLDQLEAHMSAIDDALAALTAQDDALAASVTDLIADVRALIDQLRNAPLTPEQQAAVDALSARLSGTAAEVASLDTEVGDADGSENPTP